MDGGRYHDRLLIALSGVLTRGSCGSCNKYSKCNSTPDPLRLLCCFYFAVCEPLAETVVKGLTFVAVVRCFALSPQGTYVGSLCNGVSRNSLDKVSACVASASPNETKHDIENEEMLKNRKKLSSIGISITDSSSYIISIILFAYILLHNHQHLHSKENLGLGKRLTTGPSYSYLPLKK